MCLGVVVVTVMIVIRILVVVHVQLHTHIKARPILQVVRAWIIILSVYVRNETSLI